MTHGMTHQLVPMHGKFLKTPLVSVALTSCMYVLFVGMREPFINDNQRYNISKNEITVSYFNAREILWEKIVITS